MLSCDYISTVPGTIGYPVLVGESTTTVRIPIQISNTAGETEGHFAIFLCTMKNYSKTKDAQYKSVKFSLSVHNYHIEANGNQLTAVCSHDGCEKHPVLTLTLTASESLVYDGKVKSFTFADGEADVWLSAGLELPEITYLIKQSSRTEYLPLLGTLKDIGSYMAGITLDGKSAQVEFTIDKVSVLAPADAGNKEYTGGTLTADVDCIGKPYTVTINAGGTAAGRYDVVLTLSDTTIYKWSDSDEATKTLTFTITKANNTWTTTPSVSDVTYGTAISPVGAAKFGNVTVTYVGTGDTVYASSTTAPTNAGTYKATFTVTATNNYGALTKEVAFTIAKKESPARSSAYTTRNFSRTMRRFSRTARSPCRSLFPKR